MAPLSSTLRIHLDTSSADYYTCNHRVHVKVALLFIIIVQVCVEIAETYKYIMSDEPMFADRTQLVVETVEYLITVMLVVGYVKEIPIAIVPTAIVTAIVCLAACMMCPLTLFAFFFPRSKIAVDITPFEQRDETTGAAPRLFWLFILLYVMGVAFYTAWCLSVFISCFRYFTNQQAKILRQQAERMQPSVLVHPSGNGQTYVSHANAPPPASETVVPTTATGSFGNPNYSISDDEDEIFRSSKPRRSQPPAAIV